MIGSILGELVATGAVIMLLYFIYQLVEAAIKKATRDEREI